MAADNFVGRRRSGGHQYEEEEIEDGGRNRAYRSVKKLMTANHFMGGRRSGKHK